VRLVILQGIVRPKHLYTRSHYVTTVESRGNIFVKCSQFKAYADDVVIMGRRMQDVEDVFTSLVEQTNQIGIEINKKNTIFKSITKALP
jgi:hypothetical protein